MAKRQKTRRTRRKRPARSRGDIKSEKTQGTPSQSRLTRQTILPVLALVLLVAVSYFPAANAGFVWDDVIITDAKPVQTVSGLAQIWFSPREIKREAHYWPMVYTSFWLEHKLWGFAPAGYHVVNVLLHLINTLLLWCILRRLVVPGAWFVAAVFAVHPLHVESVAWVIERKDVLSALFYLTAVLAYMRFVEVPSPRRYVLVLALFAAGLLSKSIAITLPAALLIWHWWKQDRVSVRDVLWLLPIFAVGLGIALADMAYYRSIESLSLGYSLIERVLIASRALCFYVGKLLWPTELAVIYPLWDISAADPVAYLYVIAVVAVPVALYVLRHRIGRGALAGALFFAVTLSPALGFVDYGYMQYAFVADRFQYLAGIGAIAVVVVALVRVAGRLPSAARVCVSCGILVALGISTYRQVGIWQDNVTLNSHIISLNPKARGAHQNLGKGLLDQGRVEESLAATRIALEQHPSSAGLNMNVGAAFINTGRADEAEQHLRRALALDPGYTEVHVNLGLALIELGRLDEAEKHLRHVTTLDPTHLKAHINLGRALLDQGRVEESLVPTRVALKQSPTSIEANVNLGAAFIELGRLDEAEQYLRRALQYNPDNPNVLQNLAEALRMQRRYEEALDCYTAVIDIDPTMVMAYAGKGDTLFQLERYAEAIPILERAVALQPGTPMARSLLNFMGKAAEALGRTDDAARYFERAREIGK